MDFVLFAHITTAVFLIGPLTVAAAASPAAIRGGATNLPLLGWLTRTVRLTGIGSVVVFGLGLALVRDGYDFSQAWLSASMTLFLVAAGLSVGLLEKDQRAAAALLEGGGTAEPQARRITVVSAAVALCWIVILYLMVTKPGL